MLLDGHKGEHEWSRDDEIKITFPPTSAVRESKL